MFSKIYYYLRLYYRKLCFKIKEKNTNNSPNIIGKIYLVNKKINVGKNVTIYPNVQFFGDGDIIIGDNVDIGNNVIIYSSKEAGVRIGDNSMIAANTYIIDTDHGIKANLLIRDQSNTHKQVLIGNDVWIAANCNILKGSIINDGAVIGAGSVVKGEIPSYAIAVGTPAKVIKYRE